MSEHKGGLLWGDTIFRRRNVSYPFAKLIVEDEHIILKIPTTELRLSRDEIIGFLIKNRIFYKGIVFQHVNNDVPKTITFWTFQPAAVLSELNSFMGG
jgi:hypothetical protein